VTTVAAAPFAGCATPPPEQTANNPSGASAEPPAPKVATASPAAPPKDPDVAAKPVTSRPPNEAGLIPILEYHRITPKPGRYDRSVSQFRNDLERLYREGYRPVALQDVLAGKIDLPPGASPVVLTFDDADATQFRYRPDGTLDPDSAVGVLQAFASKRLNWRTRATFYVLPESAFGPEKERAQKFRFLREEMGCEIGNHTVTHRSLRSLSDEAVQKEIGGAVQKIQAILPETPVVSIALPMGISPRNRALLAKGTFAGRPYVNSSVMLVGANPAPSPFTSAFDPLRLPRIQAVEGEAGITYWLDRLKATENAYVSDGDPDTVTVPASAKVVAARVGGRTLKTNGRASGAGN
jgi:peptidoglycan/xylan/chitin deacetylase (PgdA/CDA1 family)